MSGKKPTTRTLIRRAQEADREALEALFQKAYPGLLQAARFRLGSVLRRRMDTLDLAQTVYHDALRDLADYSYQGDGSFTRWLLGILENKIRSRLRFFKAKRRSMKREVPLDLETGVSTAGPTPPEVLLSAEDRERLEAAMDRLPAADREVILSRYYLALSWAEIARDLDTSEEAAQMRCKRALAKLKMLYGEL
jgi:RNA polymerase sigma-70 factor (ECF subfamily)